MSEGRFGSAFPDAKSRQQQFMVADRDGNGGISCDEWLQWHERGFAGATKSTQGGMAAPDHETWQGAPWTVAGRPRTAVEEDRRSARSSHLAPTLEAWDAVRNRRAFPRPRECRQP
ncbi:MAG: hypothetical protein ACREJ5_05085 [Geminicoccaceae bacterium]